MAVPFHVKILEHCHISPPQDSKIPSTTLPLTFLDIPWLLYPPNQTLFFFQKPPQFKSTTTISILKQSLSLTLSHFHPLTGNLSSSPPPSKPHFTYSDADAVSLTIAESNASSSHLSGNHPRNMTMLYSLLPHLQPPSISCDTHVFFPLLAVQITFFRDSGLSIGLAVQHVAADERTLDHFMNTWASICKSLLKKDSFFSNKSLPWFDRTVIVDQSSLETTFLKQWWSRANSVTNPHEAVDHASANDIVRATFTLSLSDIDGIKHQILAKCKMKNEAPPVHLSPYVSACSLTWVCLVKAQANQDFFQKKPVYLGFNAGGITRLGYEIPKSYLGNCIAFGRCNAMGSELVGEDGAVFAAKVLGKEIKRLDGEVLGGAERWICEWEELNVRILGSPKVDSYEIDFGWGKVEKVEKISSDFRVNVISLTDSKDFKGGIEIGVALPRGKMARFISLFNDGLKDLP